MIKTTTLQSKAFLDSCRAMDRCRHLEKLPDPFYPIHNKRPPNLQLAVDRSYTKKHTLTHFPRLAYMRIGRCNIKTFPASIIRPLEPFFHEMMCGQPPS